MVPDLLADLTSSDKNEIMLYAAAELGYLDVVKFAIEKGLINYDLVMQHAACTGKIDVVRFMLEKGATDYDETMCLASYNGHMNIVKLMLEKGAMNYNWSMHNAAIQGHMDIVKLFLENGADVLDDTIRIVTQKEYNIMLNLLLQHKKSKNKIVVFVEGGVVQDILNIPPGFQVIVKDYDVEGRDMELETDENGDEYFKGVWE